MKTNNIIFYIPDEVIRCSGVLQSQILGQARFLNNSGFQCLVVGSDVNKKLAFETEKMIEKKYDVQACISDSYSGRFPFFSKFRLSRKVFDQCRHRIDQFQPTHIYTRSCIAAVGISKIAKKQNTKLIYDLRETAAAEAIFTRERKDVYYYGLRWLQNLAMKKADRLSCVSHRLGEWIKETTGETDYVVIPCCVSHDNCSFNIDERQKSRRRLGYLPNNKVICYVGGVSKWQRIRSIIRLFKGISELSPDFRFLFISRQKQEVEKMIKDIGLDIRTCYCVSCEQVEVSSYLRVCDASIIMRDDVLMNNVSSPIKIGEYLRAGLPVLLTKGIGDMSELIPRENAGMIIDENNKSSEQVIQYLSNVNYKEVYDNQQKFVKEHLTWNVYAAEFNKLYS